VLLSISCGALTRNGSWPTTSARSSAHVVRVSRTPDPMPYTLVGVDQEDGGVCGSAGCYRRPCWIDRALVAVPPTEPQRWWTFTLNPNGPGSFTLDPVRPSAGWYRFRTASLFSDRDSPRLRYVKALTAKGGSWPWSAIENPTRCPPPFQQCFHRAVGATPGVRA